MSSVNVSLCVSRLQAREFTNVALLALIIINHLHTIAEEYDLVWKSRWSVVKILFFISRYAPFMQMLLMMICYNVIKDYHSFVSLNRVATAFGVLGVIAAQLILLLRTRAVWGPSKWFSMGLSTFVLAIIIAGVYTTVLYSKTIRYSFLPVPGIVTCLTVEENSDIEGIIFILILILETVIAGLTTYKGLKHFRHLRSPLWVTLFVDGVLYYFLIVASTIASIILLFLLPAEVSTSIVPLQAMMHSVFSCRIVLHLRAVDARMKETTGFPLESLHFAVPPRAHSAQLSEIADFVSSIVDEWVSNGPL